METLRALLRTHWWAALVGVFFAKDPAVAEILNRITLAVLG